MENKGTLIKDLLEGEILLPAQQKYLAKFTKDGICRKIKCVDDIFNKLFFSTVLNNQIVWILKPTSFLYIRQLELISNNSRETVRKIVNSIINQINIIKTNIETNNNDNIQELIILINDMVNILFDRNGGDIRYFFECISIILMFGLKLEDYFFSEFTN